MFSPQQYQAIRTKAGIVDASDREPIEVSGADRAAFLQGLLTNDIAALAPGQGCYAAYLTPQGRMISDMRVLETGDLIVLDVPGRLKGGLLARLDQLIFTEDVRLQDLSERWTTIGVHGPGSASILSGLVGGPPAGASDLAAWPEFRNARVTWDGSSALMVASRRLGEIGFDVFVEHASAENLRRALRAAGAADVDVEVSDVLRVEAGRPEFGVDMDEETIPLEAGLEDRAISFTKGCYVGQEVVIRIMHRGHGRVARLLVGLVIDAAPERQNVPPRGARLLAGGQPVGEITSAVVSPAVGKPIALGYVKRELAEPATVVQVQYGEHRLEAVVARLPFISPDRPA